MPTQQEQAGRDAVVGSAPNGFADLISVEHPLGAFPAFSLVYRDAEMGMGSIAASSFVKACRSYCLWHTVRPRWWS